MTSGENSVARFVNLCHLFLTELGMPNMALHELLNRASTETGLESFESVRFWKFVTEPFRVEEEKVDMGPFKPAKKVGKRPIPIPDHNQPAPENEQHWELDLELKLFNAEAFGIMQDDPTDVETESSTTADGKGNVVKRTKFAVQNVGPANNEKG